MIVVNHQQMIAIVTDLDYFKQSIFPGKLQLHDYLKKHYNIIRDTDTGGNYTLRFPTPKQKLIFTLKYSHILYNNLTEDENVFKKGG